MAAGGPTADAAAKAQGLWSAIVAGGFGTAIAAPFLDAALSKRLPAGAPVDRSAIDTLISSSSILFGFTTLVVITKEWLPRQVWTLLMPPLALLVAAVTSVTNLALGFGGASGVLLLCAAAFNANVVASALVLGVVMRGAPGRPSPYASRGIGQNLLPSPAPAPFAGRGRAADGAPKGR